MVAEPRAARIPTWRKVVAIGYMLFAVLTTVVALIDGPRILALTGLALIGMAFALLDPRSRKAKTEDYVAPGLALLMGVMVAVILMAVGLELGLALYLGAVVFLLLGNGYVVATLLGAFRRREIVW